VADLMDQQLVFPYFLFKFSFPVGHVGWLFVIVAGKIGMLHPV
jgi:hypothetical protein